MACVLTRVVGDPDCNMKGASNSSVVLKLVSTSGTGRFESASYDGTKIITGATDELSFQLKPGSKLLSIVCTFSSHDGAAELREKCEDNTLLDGSINAVNNGKLYHVCGI